MSLTPCTLKYKLFFICSLLGSVTAEQLLDILKDTGETFKARFVGDQRVRYLVGAASESVAKFGEFEIIDSYEEKFVLTYTLSGGIFPIYTLNLVVFILFIPVIFVHPLGGV